MRQAEIYRKGILAGVLTEDGGEYRFCYDESYLKNEDSQPVSLTLPLRKETYVSPVLFAFIFLDYSSNDFEYWEVSLDDQTVRQTNQQLDFVYINNTELPLGVHSYRFDLHHGGSTTSFECSFTIAASE